MTKRASNLLKGARVYLSGPMDFVASRKVEKKSGWRNRIGQFLKHHGATVFDPWNKPLPKGLWEYGQEDEKSIEARELWTFKPGKVGAKKRSQCAQQFWETQHIDLRMVDISDMVIAYCPTNIYSVGTPHEIVLARQQRKPVLFVSPPVTHTALEDLRSRLIDTGDSKALKLLARLENEVPVKSNPKGVPSLWYMPLIDSEMFFDGFGFNDDRLRKKYKWGKETPLDTREHDNSPKRPLLKFLNDLTHGKFPQKWEHRTDRFEQSDDWLLLEESID